MKSKRVIVKVVILITSFIFIFLVPSYFYFNKVLFDEINQLKIDQKKYIINHFNEDLKNNIENELYHIDKSNQVVLGAISTALFHLDKEVLENILNKLIQIESIYSIEVYDLLVDKTYTRVTKQYSAFNKDSFFKYSLITETNDKIGYLYIYYSTQFINAKNEDNIKNDLMHLNEKFKLFERNFNLVQKWSTIFIIIFFFILIALIILVLYKQVNNPLKQLQNNLNSFFLMLNNADTQSQSFEIKGDDEFGRMGSEINDNLKTIVSLHNKIAYLLKTLDKNVLFAQCDKDGLFTSVSSAYCELSGYSEREFIGKKHTDFLNDSNNIDLLAGASLRNQFIDDIEYIKKDGSAYWVKTTLDIQLNEQQEVESYTGIMLNMTDQHEVKNLHKELELTQRDIIFTIGSICEGRSRETGMHVKRVALYSGLLASLYGLNSEDVELIKACSPMHDIGKIAIPDNILHKPDKLTIDEFEIMKQHAELGYEMLKYSKRPIMRASAIIAYTHHEKFDGNGYPQGLSGSDIPIFGRITALADVFDALGSERSYKKPWADKDILDLFERESGKHFDPQLVAIFKENKEKFYSIRNQHKD